MIISLQSKECVDKGTLLEKVQHSDANRHMLDVVGNQDRDGGVALQVEETGYRLKVIERERRSVAWTPALFTLLPFQLRYDVQHEVDGFHSLCFSCQCCSFRGWEVYATQRSVSQYLEDHLVVVCIDEIKQVLVFCGSARTCSDAVFSRSWAEFHFFT